MRWTALDRSLVSVCLRIIFSHRPPVSFSSTRLSCSNAGGRVRRHSDWIILVHNLVATSKCPSYLDVTVRMYGVILSRCTIKHDRQSCVCIFVQTQYFRLRVRELKLATTNSHSSYWDGWDQLVGRALRHRPTRL